MSGTPDDVERPGIAGRADRTTRNAVAAPVDLAAPPLCMRIAFPGAGVREEAREINGALGVEEAAALAKRMDVRLKLRGVLQDRLDEVWRKRGIGLEHQRDRAGNNRRRHAGPGQRQVWLVSGVELPVDRYAGFV